MDFVQMISLCQQRRVVARYLGLLLCLLFPAVAFSADVVSNNRYAITLLSSQKPIQVDELPNTELLQKHLAYITRFNQNGQIWYRLRLGFFDSVNDAKATLRQLRFNYRDAWINKVSNSEFVFAGKNRVIAAAAVSPATPLEQAGQALTRGATAEAISLLQRFLAAVKRMSVKDKQAQAAQAREALELLGVAQERAGDNRAAIVTYNQYLVQYDKGEDVERVRQRLVVLQTVVAVAPKAMAKFEEKPDSMLWNGSFSQFSNRDVRFLDNGDFEISSILFSNLNVSGQYRSEAVDMRTQIDTSYRYKFNADNTTDDQLRLSSLFVDVNEKHFNTGARLGRQSTSSGGILGRFDGARLSYRPLPRWKYNLVAGYPVELSSSSTIDETDRYFVGLGVDMGSFAEVWDLSVFGITQKINGIVDRQAVGGEIRYSDRNQTHLVLLDYDVSYSQLNSFLTLSNWFLPTQTSINIVLDVRAVPVLTTTNALIGRAELGVDDLLLILSEDEVRQLARDRTSRSYSASFGVSHPFSDKYQINADVTAYNQANTPASGGVPAVDNGGDQFTYSLTMIGSGVFKLGDISILGLRYADTINAAIKSLNINVRYPLTHAWRAGPAIVVDYRDNIVGFDQLTIKPSMRIDYRWLNNITFDAEIAVLHTETLDSDLGSDTDLYFELGYRVDF
jgi:hypothetical protein